MTAQTAQIRIRDLRQKEKFVIDDAYMNGYARFCGWQATITYNSLCRHANKDQYCFPSIELMAKENGVDRKTIMKGLQLLQAWNIVQIQKERTPSGAFRNNAYILLDKSQWKSKNQVPVEDMEPSPCGGLVQVPVEDTKVTHIKDIKKEIYKERKFSSLKEIQESDLLEISEKYRVSLGFVKLQLEKLRNYCGSKGKTYKNYKLALQNFVLGDMQKQIERSANDPKRGVDARNV